MTDNQNRVHMGRNYDFKLDTSAMLVYCTPQNGYKSVAFAALDNISANTPDESMKKKLATLTSPFICLDGMNEKGVSIAVLTLDSEPVFQNTGKPTIATTLAIRLVLDRAASTQEAVDLLKEYDIAADRAIENEGKSLSVGQRKKLLIMKMLLRIEEASVLIVDEIEAGLDQETREKYEQLLNLIAKKKNKLIIVVEHDPQGTIEFTKIMHFEHGHIVNIDNF